MGLIETEAIVLRTYNLAEADKIVICLARKTGLIRAVARGAKRLKSRFGASLEPFTLIGLSYFEKEGRELVSLRQAEILRSYFGLTHNVEMVASLAYMSELIMEFAPPHEPNERLFRMVSACTEAVAHAPDDLQAIVRYFEVWTLKLAGFLPDLRSCAECHKRFSEGAVIYLDTEGKGRCTSCSSVGTLLSLETHAQLREAQRLSPIEYAKMAREMTAAERRELAQLTQQLIERALERRPRVLTGYMGNLQPL